MNQLTVEEELILNDFYDNGEFLLQDEEEPEVLLWDDYDKVKELLDNRGDIYIVTMVDGDNDTRWLVKGYHYVNRVGYYVLTAEPKMDKDIKCY